MPTQLHRPQGAETWVLECGGEPGPAGTHGWLSGQSVCSPSGETRVDFLLVFVKDFLDDPNDLSQITFSVRVENDRVRQEKPQRPASNQQIEFSVTSKSSYL